MQIHPLADRVLLRMLDAEDSTPGGLIIPDVAKEKPRRGVVVAIGNGKRLDSGEIAPCELRFGDTVLVDKYAGVEIKLDGVDHVVISEAEVLGVYDA